MNTRYTAILGYLRGKDVWNLLDINISGSITTSPETYKRCLTDPYQYIDIIEVSVKDIYFDEGVLTVLHNDDVVLPKMKTLEERIQENINFLRGCKL